MPTPKDRLACWCIDRYADIYRCFNPVTPVDTGALTGWVVAVKTGQVNFYIYQKGGATIAIDCGFGSSVICRELATLGLDPGMVSHIFLTHSDFDHAGGLRVFRGARVFLSRDEAPLADGTRARMFGLVRNRLARPCDVQLADGDVVHIGDIAVEAIATPGHTPGSMSYLVDSRYLFTGDAFRILEGRVRPIRAFLMMDPAEGMRSIEKLARLRGVEAVFTGHRGCSKRFDAIMAHYRAPRAGDA